MTLRPAVFRFLPVVSLLTALPALAQAPGTALGIDVGKPSTLRNLVPAADLEKQAASEYGELKRQAAAKGALGSDRHPQVQRLRAIAARMIPLTSRYNPRASRWHWEVNLIGSKQVNAFCMPGGKIAFYSGLLDTLKLSDDEVAVVMGHEIAHALREHVREQIAKNELTQLGTSVLSEVVGRGRYGGAFSLGSNLLKLSFSRKDESEADLVGLDLSARAGYDPRAGVTLWQKMGALNKGTPPQWLSTHPAGANRIKEIERHLPQVMPLYEEARARSSPGR